MIRTILLAVMVMSFFGLGVCDLMARQWRTGIALILLGVVQLIVFWRKL